jgi:hypothetical protein
MIKVLSETLQETDSYSMVLGQAAENKYVATKSH